VAGCRRLIGGAGRAYASAAQADAKVVSSAPAGAEQHGPVPPSQPSPPTKFVIVILLSVNIRV